MKGKKYGIVVSVITMIISLVLILLINAHDANKYALLSNILIGILGSSVVTLIISISDYIVAKRESLEDYFDELYKVIIAFNKIKYVHLSERLVESAKFKTGIELQKNFDNESSDMSEIVEYYEKHHHFDLYPDELTDEQKNQIILHKINKDIAKIIKSMNSYLQFDNVSYERVENAYRRISFLTDKPRWICGKENSYRIWLYTTFHKKLRDMINDIRLANYHFNLFKNQEANNLLIIVKQLEQLNNKLFDVKTERGVETLSVKVYFSFFDDMMDNLEDFRSRIYKCEKGSRMRTPIFTQISELPNANDYN